MLNTRRQMIRLFGWEVESGHVRGGGREGGEERGKGGIRKRGRDEEGKGRNEGEGNRDEGERNRDEGEMRQRGRDSEGRGGGRDEGGR